MASLLLGEEEGAVTHEGVGGPLLGHEAPVAGWLGIDGTLLLDGLHQFGTHVGTAAINDA